MTSAARAAIFGRLLAGLALPAVILGLAAPVAHAAGGGVDDPKLGQRIGQRIGDPKADDPRLDDPKMARRLGSRIDPPGVADATPAAAADQAVPAPEADVSSSRVAPRAVAGTAGELVATSSADAAAVSREPGAGPQGRTPVIGLGYRRFSFVQVGATGSAAGAASSEPFDTVSLDFYPISRVFRFGLSTQYGWQSGRFNAGGDYFIAQSTSLGVQSPGTTVTPFAEAFAGGGYLRRTQFNITVPTAYWQFGIDAGASFFVAEHGYLSVALGYLRPVNGFLKMQSFSSVYVDTWSLKIGFGI